MKIRLLIFRILRLKQEREIGIIFILLFVKKLYCVMPSEVEASNKYFLQYHSMTLVSFSAL